jgi:archaemetzincin
MMAARHGAIGVVPLGVGGDAVVRIIAANLQALFHLPVDILPNLTSPDYALNGRRQQYNAALILKRLAESRYAHRRVVGVVNVDLFIPVLTYVFGEAQLGGRAAVVSLHRLGARENGGQASFDILYERAAKVSVHELAHTFALVHCNQQADCVMRASYGLGDLDGIPLFFCDYCKAFLAEAYRRFDIQELDSAGG